MHKKWNSVVKNHDTHISNYALPASFPSHIREFIFKFSNTIILWPQVFILYFATTAAMTIKILNMWNETITNIYNK